MMRGKFTPHFYSGGRLCQKRKLVKISLFPLEEKEFQELCDKQYPTKQL